MTRIATSTFSRRIRCSIASSLLKNNKTDAISNLSFLCRAGSLKENIVYNTYTICERTNTTSAAAYENNESNASITNKSDESNTSNTNKPNGNVDDYHNTILQTSLKEVHEHGWTEDAIASAVVDSLNLPPSMIGLVTPESLVSFFMDECNNKLSNEIRSSLLPLWNGPEQHFGDQADDKMSDMGQEPLQKKQINPSNTSSITSVSLRIESCIRKRLEYVIPYVRSNRWAEGMAIGATKVPTTTTKQLNNLISTISRSVIIGTEHKPLTSVEQIAIAGIYVATELHLLSDDSPNYANTWKFLHERCENDLPSITNFTMQSSNMMNSDSVIAATAVSASLGSAVVSLLQPGVRSIVSAAASTIILPTVTSFMQQNYTATTETNHHLHKNDISSTTRNMEGTKPSDY